MKNFIQRMQEEKTPHERRQWAVRVAGAITAVFFVGWLATLGVRLGSSGGEVANTQSANPQTASLGGVIPATQQNSTLLVATSSVYSY